MSDALARAALAAAPPYPGSGYWTPMRYTRAQRGAAASDLASAIRTGAYYLTLEERTRLAVELISPHSCDHARILEFEPKGS